MTKTHSVSVDDRAGTSLQTKAYLDQDENVDLIIVSDGPSTIVAVPKGAAERQAGIGAGDLDCLAKCIKIEDLEARLNCILLCPAATGFHIYVRAEQRL